MFAKHLRIVLCSLWGLWAAGAADPWQGARIMPKSDQLALRVGSEYTAGIYALEWPATVERIEGQWLWISDHSGYRVPSVAGWVSKDEVVTLADAQSHYLRVQKTMDAPWVHWLLGICLEQSKETETAQQEYARCLNVQPYDPQALRAAVEMNADLLDAAVRLERLQAAAVKSAGEVLPAGKLLWSFLQAAEKDGIGRPYVFFEYAEILRRAFRFTVTEQLGNIHGMDAQIAAALAERNGGSGPARELFQSAAGAYQRSVSPNPGSSSLGPHSWKGLMGGAELYLDRASALEDEAWSLIRGGVKTPSDSPAESRPGLFGAPITQIDVPALDAFLKRWQSPQQRSALAKQAEGICVCLVEEISALQVAGSFLDAAVACNPDPLEAYRDRGLAWFALARCEATLAALEKGDADLQARLAGLYPGRELSPQKLDRALLEGRRRFNEAVAQLPALKATEAALATAKKDLAASVQQIAAAYVAAASKHGGFAAKEQNQGTKAAAPTSDLLLLQQKLAQLRADAAAAAKKLDQEDKKVKEGLSEANAMLDESYTVFSKSKNLREARRSAQIACEKGNLAGTESLKILAAIFAAECNYDRAEFYQKLAATFASDDDRHEIYETLGEYRKMGDMIAEKAKAKTPSAPSGQSKGSKGSSDDHTEGGASNDE